MKFLKGALSWGGIMKRHAAYYVYIVQCVNGTYYTGYTGNILQRIEAHNKGSGAKYLKGKTPVQLVYLKQFGYYKNALKEERRIKTFKRKKKEELIEGYAKSLTVAKMTSGAI